MDVLYIISTYSLGTSIERIWGHTEAYGTVPAGKPDNYRTDDMFTGCFPREFHCGVCPFVHCKPKMGDGN